MGKFQDLDGYFDPGLTLTVKGKEYVLPLPSAELGLWCRRIAQTAGEVDAASTREEIEAAAERANARIEVLPELPGDLTFPERVLGDAYQQMVADGVPDPYIEFCATTAYIWIIADEDTAERYWTSGGRPESVARGNRAERRAAARSGRTSTGGDAATHTPASTSGTSSRKKSRSRRGSGSPGHKS